MRKYRQRELEKLISKNVHYLGNQFKKEKNLLYDDALTDKEIQILSKLKVDNEAAAEELNEVNMNGKGVQWLVDRVLNEEENYEFIEDDVGQEYKLALGKAVKVNLPPSPKGLKYEHANNLVCFSNQSDLQFNKENNFSFMHSVFAVLLEVEVFQRKFSRGTP